MTESGQLDKIFSALADPTRRAIVARLARSGASVSELAEPFKMSQPAISKHLKILEGANLVSSQVDGQRRPRELNPQSLMRAVGWIERYREVWETNYLRLDSLLDELKAENQNPKSALKKTKAKTRAKTQRT